MEFSAPKLIAVLLAAFACATAFAISDSEIVCLTGGFAEFDMHEQAKLVAQHTPDLDALKITITERDGQFYVNDRPATKLKAEEGGAASNRSEAIYFYEAEGGSHRVIKVITADEAFAKIAGYDPKGAAVEVVRANQLSDIVGGPKLYRYGTVHTPEGKVRYFVEIEELFHGDKRMNLRDMLKTGTPEEKALLLQKGPDGRTMVDRIAEMIAQAVRTGVMPDEFDVMINRRTGELRWFDPFHFPDQFRTRATDPEMIAQFTQEAVDILRNYEPAALPGFFATLRRALTESKSVGSNFKEAILGHLARDENKAAATLAKPKVAELAQAYGAAARANPRALPQLRAQLRVLEVARSSREGLSPEQQNRYDAIKWTLVESATTSFGPFIFTAKQAEFDLIEDGQPTRISGRIKSFDDGKVTLVNPQGQRTVYLHMIDAKSVHEVHPVSALAAFSGSRTVVDFFIIDGKSLTPFTGTIGKMNGDGTFVLTPTEGPKKGEEIVLRQSDVREGSARPRRDVRDGATVPYNDPTTLKFRSNLNRLRSAIWQYESGPPPYRVLIVDRHRLGKTSLALEIVRETNQRRDRAAIYVTADVEMSTNRLHLVEQAQALGLPEPVIQALKSETNILTMITTMKDALRAQGKRMLLAVDEANYFLNARTAPKWDELQRALPQMRDVDQLIISAVPEDQIPAHRQHFESLLGGPNTHPFRVSPETFESVRAYVTVYAREQRISIAPEVIRALHEVTGGYPWELNHLLATMKQKFAPPAGSGQFKIEDLDAIIKKSEIPGGPGYLDRLGSPLAPYLYQIKSVLDLPYIRR